MTSEMSPADLYAELRRQGRLVLPPHEQGKIAGLRRRGKAEGFIVVASRLGDFHRMSRYEAGRRNYEVALTSDGMHIVAPDASIPSSDTQA
jgi:hypothetical protein